MVGIELLEKVRELFLDPKRWCRGAIARDGNGRPVPWNHDEAASWCLYGAILRVAEDMGGVGNDVLCYGAPRRLVEINERGGYGFVRLSIRIAIDRMKREMS